MSELFQYLLQSCLHYSLFPNSALLILPAFIRIWNSFHHSILLENLLTLKHRFFSECATPSLLAQCTLFHQRELKVILNSLFHHRQTFAKRLQIKNLNIDKQTQDVSERCERRCPAQEAYYLKNKTAVSSLGFLIASHISWTGCYRNLQPGNIKACTKNSSKKSLISYHTRKRVAINTTTIKTTTKQHVFVNMCPISDKPQRKSRTQPCNFMGP